MNAKELLLAKINAGPELAGTYIYLLQQGISFDDITNFMVSSTIDAIVKESKGNVFSSKSGSIDKAVKFFLEGANWRNFCSSSYQLISFSNFVKQDSIKNILKTVNQELYEALEYKDVNGEKVALSVGTILNKMVLDMKPEDIINLRDLIMSKLTNENTDAAIFAEDPEDIMAQVMAEAENALYGYTSKDSNTKLPIARFFDKAIYRALLIASGKVNIDKVKQFKLLYDESKELLQLGTRLGINGGMKTLVYELYAFNERFSNWLRKRLNSMPKDLFESICGEVKSPETIDKFSDIRRFRDQKVKPLDLAEHEIFRKIMIELYNNVRAKHNILKVETQVPHFNAMLDTLNTALLIFEDSSYKYRKTMEYIDTISRLLPRNADGSRVILDEDLVKAIENLLTSGIIGKFVEKRGFAIHTLKNQLYYDDDMKLTQSDGSVSLNLNSMQGRASFKLMVEQYVDLLKQQFPENDFIQSLTTDFRRDNITGKNFLFIKLNMDMSRIKTDYDNRLLEKIVLGFTALLDNEVKSITDAQGRKYSIADMFMLYNMLVNNNSFGANYMTKVFESSVKDSRVGSTSLITDFMQFVGNVDFSNFDQSGNRFGDFVNLDALLMATAPKYNKNFNGNQGEYVKVYDFNLGHYVFKRGESLVNLKTQANEFVYNDMDSNYLIDGVPSFMLFASGLKTKVVQNLLNGTIDTAIDSGSKVNVEALYNSIIQMLQEGNLTIILDC